MGVAVHLDQPFFVGAVARAAAAVEHVLSVGVEFGDHLFRRSLAGQSRRAQGHALAGGDPEAAIAHVFHRIKADVFHAALRKDGRGGSLIVFRAGDEHPFQALFPAFFHRKTQLHRTKALAPLVGADGIADIAGKAHQRRRELPADGNDAVNARGFVVFQEKAGGGHVSPGQVFALFIAVDMGQPFAKGLFAQAGAALHGQAACGGVFLNECRCILLVERGRSDQIPLCHIAIPRCFWYTVFVRLCRYF